MATIQIKLNDKYILCHDKYQWWFGKTYKNKDGTLGFHPITGYFRELSGAFEDLGKREARSIDAESVQELVEALRHHEAAMHELAQGITEALADKEGRR